MTEICSGTNPAGLPAERILGLLGLAAKAGTLVSGAENIIGAIRSGDVNGRSGLIVIACDASARTKKNIALAADGGGIRCAEICADMFTLGHRTGCRGQAAAIAITGKNFVSALTKLI